MATEDTSGQAAVKAPEGRCRVPRQRVGDEGGGQGTTGNANLRPAKLFMEAPHEAGEDKGIGAGVEIGEANVKGCVCGAEGVGSHLGARGRGTFRGDSEQNGASY
jgi:hypothetical protein